MHMVKWALRRCRTGWYQALLKKVKVEERHVGASENVLFEQSRNVLLTAVKLGRCKTDNY
jgi:hypothetical protein